MNLQEFKEHTKNMCENIKNKLDKDSEEFDFFFTLVNTFNEVCNENRKLENVLDEIEKWLKEKAEQMDTFNIT